MSTITQTRLKLVTTVANKSAAESHLNSNVAQGGDGFPVVFIAQRAHESDPSTPTHYVTETQMLPEERSMLEATALDHGISHGLVAIWVDYGDGQGPQKQEPENPSTMEADMGLVPLRTEDDLI